MYQSSVIHFESEQEEKLVALIEELIEKGNKELYQEHY